jgi:hypothetical protein
MKRNFATAIVFVLSSAVLYAQVQERRAALSVLDAGERPMTTAGMATATELMERFQTQQLERKALLLDATSTAIVFAAAGHILGANNQVVWRSDVQFANYRSTAQKVAVGFLSAGVPNGSKIPKILTIPAMTVVFYRDFVGSQLLESGLGSILAIGVLSDNVTPDTSASIDGGSRIYTTNSSGGSLNQFFPAVPVNDLFGGGRGVSMGLRQDTVFRTNVGVANFDTAVAHTFSVRIVGNGTSNTSSVTVPPLSMMQVPAPGGNFGDVFVQFDAPAGNYTWSAYGATVDGGTSDGWSVHAALTF